MIHPHRSDVIPARVPRSLQRLVRGLALNKLAFALLAVLPASAQSTNCGDWSGNFGPPGVAGVFSDFMSFDDGSGLAVYGAGGFVGIGQERMEGVSRWDGLRWHPVGTGLEEVRCLAVFDDGAGPKLYAGGNFQTTSGAPANGIARWNGTSWQPLPGTSSIGTPVSVSALQVHDDGTGSALYVGGFYSSAGTRLARWNGSAWSNAGAGLSAGATPQLSLIHI